MLDSVINSQGFLTTWRLLGWWVSFIFSDKYGNYIKCLMPRNMSWNPIFNVAEVWCCSEHYLWLFDGGFIFGPIYCNVLLSSLCRSSCVPSSSSFCHYVNEECRAGFSVPFCFLGFQHFSSCSSYLDPPLKSIFYPLSREPWSVQTENSTAG